jgi:hypothetical protein
MHPFVKTHTDSFGMKEPFHTKPLHSYRGISVVQPSTSANQDEWETALLVFDFSGSVEIWNPSWFMWLSYIVPQIIGHEGASTSNQVVSWTTVDL